MPYLTAAVILLALLSVGHLLVTLGLVRRIRTMSEQTGSPAPTPPALAIGSSPAEFSVTSDDGRHFDRAGLVGGRTLVGFFSTTCEPCKQSAPKFAEYARAFDGDRVLAVVQDGEPGQAQAFGERYLAGVATVVDPMNGPLARAFTVEAFPTMYVLDDAGRVEHSAFNTSRLPELPPVREPLPVPQPAGA